MDTVETTDLRALAEAATPGPWFLVGGEPWYGNETAVRAYDDSHGAVEDELSLNASGSLFHGDVVHEPDAAFIAAANPTAVLGLLDELEALRGTYEVGYRDGESSVAVDLIIALDDVWPATLPEPSPTVVAEYIKHLQIAVMNR